MRARPPFRGLGPYACLAITLAYLVALVPPAYLYLDDGQTMAGIEDTHGVLAVAWVGSLGAVIASFSDIARNSDKWNPHQAMWYLVRPFTGAAFGAIGYLIYLAVIHLSITESEQTDNRPAILGYVIAFTLGYREEMFRELLKRITDLLATAGGADVEPPSAPPELECELSHQDVTISWRPSSDNVAVAGYRVYRNRWFLARVLVDGGPPEASGTGAPRPDRISFVDRSVRAPGELLYSVTAVDAAGNESDPAGPVRVRLPGGS